MATKKLNKKITVKSVIVSSIIIIFLATLGYYFGKLSFHKNTSTTQVENNYVFDKANVKVGDVIAGMVVKEIKTGSEGSEEELTRRKTYGVQPPEEDISISFTGNTTISAAIEPCSCGFCFITDDTSPNKLPKTNDAKEGLFCFRNTDESVFKELKLDSKGTTHANITINNYTIDHGFEWLNFADLISVSPN